MYAYKTYTTPDVTTGILNALKNVVERSGIDPEEVIAAMLGTTHCTNAIVERRRLNRVGVIRIGKPASMAIKPLRAFPHDLREAIGNVWAIVEGGHEYDGREISPLNEDEIRRQARRMKDEGIDSIAICSIFSPVSQEHEKRAAEIIHEELGENFPVTLSYEIGSIGLLERENATVLNAAVIDVAKSAISAFEKAMHDTGLHKAKLYLTQNDGTLMSADYARRYPIRTIASGPTNSMRGAAFLTKIQDGIVIDIGGTTTLVGALVKGFPRESAVAVEIGGVRTNFRMPDLIAIGCGGGTIVRKVDSDIAVGPQSVGYELIEKGYAWGGDTITTTDIALAAGYARIDDPRIDYERLKEIDRDFVAKAVAKIVNLVESSIDKIKTTPDPLPVVLVGGGSIIIPPDYYDKLRGVSKVIKPPHFQFANAIGAAIAQVSGEVDRVFSLEHTTREKVIEEAKKTAIQEAIRAGANPNTVNIVEVDEIPLAYLPGNAVRVRVKAVGELTVH